MPPVENGNGIGFRRNGKMRACEPCRKGKLACDHTAPYCGRCVRRKMTDKCIYHPNPMTGMTPPKGRAPTAEPEVQTLELSPEELRVLNQFRQAPPQQPAQPPQTVPPGGSIPLSSPIQVNPETHHQFRDYVAPRLPNVDRWKTSIYPRSARYNGPTSFSAVFSENRTNNGDLMDIDENTRKHPGAWPFGQPLLGKNRPSAPDIRRKDMVKVLWNIPSPEICEVLLNKSGVLSNLIYSHVMIKHCVSKLWSTFSDFLIPRRTGDPNQKYNLGLFADHLFENEERPLQPTPDDGMEWLDTFTGPNMRIEMLGLLFCFFGRAYLTLQDSDPVFKVPENFDKNRKETAWRMTECADVCRKHCHLSETVNEIVVALSYSIHILESFCAGNDSYLTRCRHGDMVTTAITMGLHRLPDYANTKITTASEYKRRLFSHVYYVDKSDSSLNGIPPMLSRLYCDVKPCLDLSEEQLFLPQEELAAEVAKLDASGWNTEGDIYPVTISRATWQLFVVREEILELALGVNVFIAERNITNLHERCERVLDNLPKKLLYYDPGKVPKRSTGSILFSQACIMLDYLQNLFLIERVASARGFPNSPNLLSTAMETLELALMFWMRRDELAPYTSYFDWILTFYGIPSAGVICVELLKGAKSPPNNQSRNANSQSSTFSRSDAIQKLTLFIGFLEWIRPTDGNYKLAGRLKKVVRKVLDHVLDPKPDANMMMESQDEGSGSGNGNAFDPTLLQINGGLGDELGDLDWLGSIDWTQGSWIGL